MPYEEDFLSLIIFLFIYSFLLNIVTSSDYKLPHAVITLNDAEYKNPPDNFIEINFAKPATFDASKSQTGSSKFTTYMWNFGDGQTSTKQIDTHKLINQYDVTVVLKVKHSNGFISDTFLGLRDNPNLSAANNIVIKKKSTSFPFLEVIFALVVLIGLGIIIKTHVKISVEKNS